MSQETFYFQVCNQTGANITNGAVTHVTSSYPATTCSLNGLGNGSTSAITTGYTGPSSTDYWYITWSNDGQNYVAFMGDSAIHDHWTPQTPALITLHGQLNSTNGADLQIAFETDGSSISTQSIDSPWT